MLDRENTGLIVVDVQGKLARLVHDSDVLIANTVKLVKGAQALGLPIVLVEQNPERLGSTVDELQALLTGNPAIPKFTFDACKAPAFLEAIKHANVTTWLICGIEAHICVYQTAQHLHQLGCTVELVQDCVSSRAPENTCLAISKLSSKAIGITGLEMCLYELVEDCRADGFKTVLGLVK
ncbi:isochorismatase family protein [Enterovibrio norvegicus]|uniref:isochorismatase family protein n=1 Tax=Enterovibrio norvegicus TaxID=188144 RepID=UPI0013D1DEEE|nr:isochorismatase family protein [Enterovibrio norvegicus]